MARARKKTSRGTRRGAGRSSADDEEEGSFPTRTLLRARRVGLVTVLVAFLAGLWMAGWLLDLDEMVVSRFEGRRFSVPSRVYAAPIVIYPGVDWQRLDLAGWLARMGYREQQEAGPLIVGHYRWLPGRLRVHLRSFDHPQLPESERKVEFRLEEGRVREMRDDHGEPVSVVALEPEPIHGFVDSFKACRIAIRGHYPPLAVQQLRNLRGLAARHRAGIPDDLARFRRENLHGLHL